jgi:integrase
MSLYQKKPGGNWLYDFQWQGHRVFGSTGTNEKRLAKTILAAKRAELVRDVQLGPSRKRVTVDQTADIYFEEVGKHTKSAAWCESILALIVERLGPDTMIDALTDSDIAAFVARRRGDASRRSQHRRAVPRVDMPLVASATVNRATELLRRMIRRAVKTHKYAGPDIDWSAHILKEPPGRTRYLSDVEEDRLFSELPDHLHAPVRFALLTGLRLNNIAALDWSQIDIQGRRADFIVKGNRPLALPLTEDIVVLLANQGPQERGPVWHLKGRPLKNWRSGFRAAVKRAGLDNFRFHDLRHTVGTRVVDATGNLRLAQEILGHAKITSTARYAHVSDAAKLDAMAGLSRQNPDSSNSQNANALKRKRN